MKASKSKTAEPFDTKPLLRNMTQCPGAYRMLDACGGVIYVGKARNLKRRIGSYFKGRAQDAKTMAMLEQVANVEVTVTRTEAEALMLEYNLIKRHKPRFNVLLRDDKSYPYIHISTDHDYPRLSFYRGARKKSGRMFGPYPSAGSVRATLSQLQKLFQLRLCEDSYFSNRSRPCLQHQIDRCSAPCVGLISREDYARDIEHVILFLQGRNHAVTDRVAESMEVASSDLRFELAAQYRDQLAKLKSVEASQLVSRSSGDFDAIGIVCEEGLYCATVMYFRGGRLLGSCDYFPRTAADSKIDEVTRAFILQYYGGRSAPKEILVSQPVPEADLLTEMLAENTGHRVSIKYRVRGDRSRWLAMAVTNANNAVALRHKSEATVAQQLEALAEALNLDEVPRRLECFDVSHTQGEATVASCVVFGVKGPLKSDYRRLNICDVVEGDDYSALAQALERRYARVKKGEEPTPDVLVIDGGRGQLGKAFEVVAELQLDGLQLVGVAKGKGRRAGRERLYLPGRPRPLILAANSPALHLIQKIRDEAHRFAIAGHRSRRQKRRKTSPLEAIPGVGPKRRREVLRQFGGLQAVTRASIDDLERVPGISRCLATSIYEYFHAK